jgi:histidine triad (HIT) family protein
MSDCVFCDIVRGEAPADIVYEWVDAVAFPPKPHPVVVGYHLLIVPKRHIRDMLEDPIVTGLVARRAAELAVHLGWAHGNFAFNLGEFGGQTVRHLHGHLLLADENVQHTMPWTGQARGA